MEIKCRCGNKPLPQKKHCETCRLKFHERNITRRKHWQSLGLCIECGKHDQREGRVTCQICADKHRRRQETATAMRRKARQARYKQLTKLQSVYLAGLFDGEGTVSIIRNKRIRGHQKTNRHSMLIHITNTHKGVMEWVHDTFGGNLRHYAPPNSKPEQSVRADIWRWYAVSNEAAHVLTALLPYLIIKKPQAQIAIELQQRLNLWMTKRNAYYPSESKKSWFKGAKALPPEEIELRDALMRQLLDIRRRDKHYTFGQS